MVVVALGGGTGGLGHAIYDVWRDHFKDKYELIILARKSPTKWDDEGMKLVVVADYNNEDALVDLLETHNVHTIINTMPISSAETQKAEASLIRAAERSKCVERFIPSHFECTTLDEYQVSLFDKHEFKLKSLEELRSSSLQWTHIINGFFMDYWGMPYVKTYLNDVVLAIDMKNHFAAIPGDGNTRVVFSYTFDVAYFTLQLLALDDWDNEYKFAGDVLTLNDLLHLCEETKGVKFDVHYDKISNVQANEITELPAWKLEIEKSGRDKILHSYRWMLLNMADGHSNFVSSSAKRHGRENKSFKDLLQESWGINKQNMVE